MGYEPTINAPIPLFPADEAAPPARATAPKRPTQRETGRFERLGMRRPLRFGGLSLDVLTGVVHVRGKAVSLDEDELETLQVLMENAGRIISTTHLASQLNERPDVAEQRIRALHAALRLAGSKCLPRYTNGLGYILWC